MEQIRLISALSFVQSSHITASCPFVNRVQANQFVPSMFIEHEPQMPSRQEGERGIDLVLDLDERIQDRRPAGVEIDLAGVDARVLAGVR